MNCGQKAIRFLEALAIPEGPKASQLIKLALFQKKFVKGALPMHPRHPEATKTSRSIGKTSQSRLEWQRWLYQRISASLTAISQLFILRQLNA
jgi:hypothetical protein